MFARRDFVLVLVLILGSSQLASAAEPTGLERQLLAEPPAQLAAASRAMGDAIRGAIVFHQPHMACHRCHVLDGKPGALGPDLTTLPAGTTDEQIIESVLLPSKAIRKGFETTQITTTDGRALTGIVIESTPERVVLRDASQPGKQISIAADDIDERRANEQSVMPASQVNQLGSRQQFLDLMKYLIELRDGGRDRARQLQPSPALVALELPAYEQQIDHAGILRDLDSAAFKRGEAIYQRLCVNCHGTHEQAGSLPTSLRFATGKFKSGSDPYTMYQTLTRGFGLMTPQAWMVPQQKYDVIHYIREAYLKTHNPSQFAAIEDKYLAGLPKGTTRGPAPSTFETWSAMDYGPTLIGTYETGSNGANFAYKGIAMRLDPGTGGIARGRHWMTFDHDTMRVAAAWSGTNFIDWQGIHFDGRHNAHPHVAGLISISNPSGPGWADPATGSFADQQRVVGRDGRKYGPLPRAWAQYRGLYHHGDRAIVSYTVGETSVLESAGVVSPTAPPGQVASPGKATSPGQGATPVAESSFFTRTLELGPRPRPLVMLVATAADETAKLTSADSVVRLGPPLKKMNDAPAAKSSPLEFNGANYVELANANSNKFDLARTDFTVTARLRTKSSGSIFAKTKPDSPWVPDGTTWFVRGGHLVYDIGWIGAVESSQRVDDGRWHDVALRWTQRSGVAELVVDGRVSGKRELRTKAAPEGHVVRIGFTSPNFPGPQTYFQGDLRDVRFFQKALSEEELGKLDALKEGLVAHWPLVETAADGKVVDASGNQHAGQWKQGEAAAKSSVPAILGGLQGEADGLEWTMVDNRLCLKIPAGDAPLRFSVWVARESATTTAAQLASTIVDAGAPLELGQFLQGGPPRWPQPLTTAVQFGAEDGPFAVDVLTHPTVNPWFAQIRLAGLDFLPGGDRVVVCAWDGDVWLVEGLKALDPKKVADPKSAGKKTASKKTAQANEARQATLTWRRIASGLFQPLGIKWVDGQIYVTCRDQLVVLRDLNGDGETDFYQCWNNDHQVTEHFHEFAMGLQVDAENNFYYAKSARHALPALVPHHGTLLKISRDGSSTEILANGFRAANGVCLNPDGSFVVTDQEGHWNPKNRINWVTRGGFYGNMFGYHDVTDSSDSAMLSPLCWITNAFDRSPAELLWAPRDAWGPLGGSLLNLSYGYGRVFVVPFEEIDGQKQGGMCALPIPPLPTGVMRGRFHPDDKQLYACGMFAWAGSATQPGGFYRLRYTGRPMHLPTSLKAKQGRLEITLSDPVERTSAIVPASFAVKTWSLKRSADYGSKHYDEKPLNVTAAELSPDGRTITLVAPDLSPTWGMEIVCRLRSTDGQRFERVIHNSVFRLAP